MPRNVRNFWIEGTCDGKATPIAFGPQGKDGGFSLRIGQREGGDPMPVLEVSGLVTRDGRLILRVEPTGEGGFHLKPVSDDLQRGFIIETLR